jgi:hypothetical protein
MAIAVPLCEDCPKLAVAPESEANSPTTISEATSFGAVFLQDMDVNRQMIRQRERESFMEPSPYTFSDKLCNRTLNWTLSIFDMPSQTPLRAGISNPLGTFAT